MSEDFRWLLGLAIAIVVGLMGWFARRLEAHITKCAEHDASRARLETQVSINAAEIKSIRDRHHREDADVAYKRFKDRHPDKDG